MKNAPDIFMNTISGKRVNPFDIQPDTIDLHDIAHALSMKCRFNGHCKEFYSVAEHSILVARACPAKYRAIGLLHDAAEAYICDVIRPMKPHVQFFKDHVAPGMHLGSYRDLEHEITMRILAKFIPGYVFNALPVAVQRANLSMLATEQAALMPSDLWSDLDEAPLFPEDIIGPLTPSRAEAKFIALAEELGLIAPPPEPEPSPSFPPAKVPYGKRAAKSVDDDDD